jgi:hypothetical protein
MLCRELDKIQGRPVSVRSFHFFNVQNQHAEFIQCYSVGIMVILVHDELYTDLHPVFNEEPTQPVSFPHLIFENQGPKLYTFQ